ncbi:hypothetical protein [Acinetobacter sp.]|uniref:hypothetical protein n=1 Tax=Acinetobacter sp. TaxID=472 RepID=UPI003D0589C2
MKAKQYAKMYPDAATNPVTAKAVIMAFLEEIEEIRLKRNGTKSDGAMVAIIREQADKWRAFSRLVDGVDPDGFLKFIVKKKPELVEFMPELAEYIPESDKEMTPRQIENWRKVLANIVGSTAFTMSDDGIRRVRDHFQAEIEARRKDEKNVS